jgi:ATP synthase protein I
VDTQHIHEDSFLKHAKKKVVKSDPSEQAWILMKYSNVGIAIAVPIFLGLTIGLWLDTLFATKPVITGFALVIGFIASMYQLYKITRSADK